MTIKLDNQGLRSIISEFDLLFIDIWGVIHNGINLYQDSIDVLDRLEKEKKEYVLLTNAPRPNSTVIKFYYFSHISLLKLILFSRRNTHNV